MAALDPAIQSASVGERRKRIRKSFVRTSQCAAQTRGDWVAGSEAGHGELGVCHRCRSTHDGGPGEAPRYSTFANAETQALGVVPIALRNIATKALDWR
jgi:hypothetical protein